MGILLSHLSISPKLPKNWKVLNCCPAGAYLPAPENFYDPLHLCSQVTLAIKISLQLAWMITASWDEPIVEKLDSSTETFDEPQKIRNRIWQYFCIFIKKSENLC